jgi:O6-methylguanine-DNA--protein-cysteine methyltransferase
MVAGLPNWTTVSILLLTQIRSHLHLGNFFSSYCRMPRSDEAEAFFHAVYSAVREIPYGKVTSYGHIAALVGTREGLISRTRSCLTLN